MDYTVEFSKMLDKDPIVLKEGSFGELYTKAGSLRDGDYPYRAAIKERLFDTCYNVLCHDLAILTEADFIVELGVREGFSTDAFVRACASRGSGKVLSFDPVPVSRPDIFIPEKDRYLEFHQLLGEDGYKQYGGSTEIDLLYIDTDPHSYDQTVMWLHDYWIKDVRPGGFVVLDDCAPQHQMEVSVVPPHIFNVPWGNFGVLRALVEWLDEVDDIVDYAFVMCAPQANGMGVVKFKEGMSYGKNKAD